jgi:5-hydroxyisourate hydrolase-like protein (transthyretin family)
MKIKYINKINVFFVSVLFISTCLLPINTVGSTSNPKMIDFNQENRNTPSQETEYWALLIGVGIYADDPEQNRPLMLVEVDDFYNELIKSEIWSEDHIKVIKAEDATVPNILAGFRWLDKMEDKDDISVVYLTTHGGQLGFDIPPFDEEDKKDEILSSYWNFAYPTQGIWDDELNILLNRLESKGVCLIIDSCYAGGFNDHWKGLFPLSNKDIKTSSKEWIKNFSDEIRGQGRVILMASCEDELSYSGGFAPYLIDGLRGYADSNSDGVVSAEEIFYYSEPRAYRQQPTLYDGYSGDLPLVYLNKTMKNSEDKKIILKEKNKVTNTYFELDSESSVIKGFVKDAGTNDTIEGAFVYLSGRDNELEEFFENETTTDYTGFYSFNVPPSRCRITVSADGYCGKQSGPIDVQENQTRWYNFSLYPRPPENSIVCGFIKDNDTGDPVNEVNISLTWQGTSNQFYMNNTKSDYLGFFQMNVAEGLIYLDVEANGYFQEYINQINISDYETVWLNFTLIRLPLENSVLYGYIVDKETGEPINNTRLTIQWVDINQNTEYQNETFTDINGFYSINVALGELYVDIHRMGYEYYDPYRHDADENAISWFNVSLGKQIVEVDFLTPLRALYINNKRIIPYNKVRIIGSIDIQAYIFEDEFGPWGSEVEKVEFYIDGNLKVFFTAEPFLWTWNEKTIGKHTIKIVAYDLQGNSASKELVVYKLL